MNLEVFMVMVVLFRFLLLKISAS